jgi:ATP-dependent DNA helicase RecQ
VLEKFAYGDTPAESAVAALVAEIFTSGNDFDVSVYELSNKHDVRVSVVRTLLTYLELLGHLETGTPFYSSYRFQPLLPSVEILAHFQGERREFLSRLFAQATKAKKWFQLDVDEACRAIGAPRDRAVRALDYLAEQHYLELQTSGVRYRYHLQRKPDDLEALVRTLNKRLVERESREIGRLGAVAKWVELDGCQVGALGAHFAEPMDRRCGHCSWCLRGGKPSLLPRRPPVEIDDALWAKAVALREEYAEELGEPRALARFLCGVSSPWLVRAKLQSHSLFGALGHVPFREVLQRSRG